MKEKYYDNPEPADTEERLVEMLVHVFNRLEKLEYQLSEHGLDDLALEIERRIAMRLRNATGRR